MADPRIIGRPFQGTHTRGNWQSDRAYDFALPYGTPLYAPFAGTIGSRIGSLNSSEAVLAGLRLNLEGAADDLYYAHLSRLNVRAGQRVNAGDLLGWSGRAGPDHLHLGARVGDALKYYAAIVTGKGGASSSGAAAPDTWAGWAQRFLTQLSVPVSKSNLEFMLAWLKHENPSDTYSWNPLATTLRTGSSLRPGGVQAYKDELGGIKATVQTIQGGQYAQLRAALRRGDNSQATWDALRASPWDAGHYANAPTPTFDPADAQRLVVGAKKGGGGGVLDSAQDVALGIGRQAIDPFGLLGVGKSPKDVLEAPVEGVAGAIGDAAETVAGGLKDVAVRGGYILVGLLLGAGAIVLVIRTVGTGGASISRPAAAPQAAPAASGAPAAAPGS